MELAHLNLCTSLTPLVYKIQGVGKSSASLSDIWFITFVPGVTFDNKPIDSGVMKIYFSPTKNPLIPPADEWEAEDIAALEALEYESEIYQKVVDPLVLHKLCPFFITMLGHGKDCTFKQITNILGKEIGVSQAEKNIERNFKMILERASNIPAITSMEPLKDDTEADVRNSEFSFMLLRKFTTRHATIRKYINYMSTYTQEFWLILFQICTALYALELSKTVHNDFHTDNIVIEELDRPMEVIQFVETSSGFIAYKFNTDKRVVIFDFDRSYAKQLGDNKFLDSYCKEFAGYQCSKFVKNRDLVQLFCKLYKERFNEQYRDANRVHRPLNPKPLLDVITDNQSTFMKFAVSNDFCTTNHIPPGVDDLSDIIKNCAAKAGIESTKDVEKIRKWSSSNPNTFYRLSEFDFDDYGVYRG